MATAVLFDSPTLAAAPLTKSRRKSNHENPGRPFPTTAKASQTSPSTAKAGVTSTSREKHGLTDNQTTTYQSTSPQTKLGRNNNSIPARAARRYRTGEDAGSGHRLVGKLRTRNLVMEEVTILKRGEEIKPTPRVVDQKADETKGSDGLDDLNVCTTDRLGPEPEILSKQIRLTDSKPVYAGTGFVESPSPSSLPIPDSFFAKKDVTARTDLATKGLRYLLRLDLP